jgi:hypothetical protein
MTGFVLTEAQFTLLYPDLAPYYSRFANPPPVGLSKKEFEAKYLTSKLWRLNNIYKIINKAGELVTFKMNFAQHVVYAASRVHPRIIILKSRQQGISTLWLVSYFDDAVCQGNLNLGLMAQGSDEAATLLERTKLLWDKLNDNVKAWRNVRLHKDNSKEFSFSNDSKIFIRVSFRSATLQRLHISEFGKIANQYPKRARETKTGTLQALGKGNTGVIESTAEGINDFKDMWDKAEIADRSGTMSYKDFKPVFLPWFKDPDCYEPVYQPDTDDSIAYFKKLEKETGYKLSQEQKNFWIAQERELGSDVHQEYPGTPDEAFSASKNGSYWSSLFTAEVVQRNRAVTDLYDPNLPVDVHFDLGVDDYMVLGFVQWWRGEYRIIDEYFNDGYGLEHYIDEIASRGYNIRTLKFPHDIEVRELLTGDGGKAVSRMDGCRKLIKKKKLGWKVTKVAKTNLADGIERVRVIIKVLQIDVRCTYLISCFHKYTKEWDDKLQVWKKTPRHDEYSHGADVIRSIATGTIESDRHNRSKHERDITEPKHNRGFDL